ncbi:MAG: acyltransferase [Candidatus Hodarchaeota archaeon]
MELIPLIVQLGWIVLILVLVLAFASSLAFFQLGIPVWASLVLGMFTTYILLMLLAFILHWLLRSIVGTESGYLPSWKVPLWGIMAALHHRLFSSLKLLFPREYLPNFMHKSFGMRIGSGTINMGYVTDPEMTQVGRNVYVGPGTYLGAHIMSRTDRRVFRAPIVIEDGARIGANCIISPGAHIGSKAVVLANTHVGTRQNLEPRKRYGGSPASEIPQDER